MSDLASDRWIGRSPSPSPTARSAAIPPAPPAPTSPPTSRSRSARPRSPPPSTAGSPTCRSRSSTDARARHRHRQGRGPGARADPPRRRPHHGPRRAGALARRQGHHRPGDRERLVLRLRPRRALHPRGPRRPSRRGCARSSPPATRSAPRSGTATAPSATTRRLGEPYKVELVEAIPEADPVRMYWHGPWQDLCRGPHLANTGQVPADAFKLMSIAGAYWRGDSRRPMLQRIYGVAFRTRADLDAYLHQLEEAAKRDHRRLGQGDGPLPPAAGGAGVGLLAPERLHALARRSRPTSAAGSTPTAMSR